MSISAKFLILHSANNLHIVMCCPLQ